MSNEIRSARLGRKYVWDYPRPPRLEPTAKRISIEFGGIFIADSSSTFRVLETSHPPAYYVPPADIELQHLSSGTGAS